MIIGQTLMVLNTIIKNPGLTILQLAKKIEEIYVKEDYRVQFMFLEEKGNNTHLRSLFGTLYCVEEKNGCYFYNEKLPLTDEKDITQKYIRSYLDHIKKRAAEKENKIENSGQDMLP
jgi:hypothetical protein